MRLIMSILIFLLAWMTVVLPWAVLLGIVGVTSFTGVMFFSVFSSVLIAKEVMSIV